MLHTNTGQLSAQRAVLTVKAFGKHSESIASFVEESVVRYALEAPYCWRMHCIPGLLLANDMFSRPLPY